MDIKTSILNANEEVEEILKYLKKIDKITLCVGSGGSRIVADFASKVFIKKNNIYASSYSPQDISFFYNLDKYVCIFSNHGKNHGVKSLVNSDDTILISSRKNKISNEVLLSYQDVDEHSFIAIKATIVPMSIMLHYYLGDKFWEIITSIFSAIDENLNFIGSGDIINIFTEETTLAVASFLESTLVESGLGYPLRHNKYDYCHGRSTINKDYQNDAIMLIGNKHELDDKLISVINLTMKNVLVMASPFSDDIVSDFYLTLQAIYLVKNMAKNKNIDLANVKYDPLAVKNLYHFKGSM